MIACFEFGYDGQIEHFSEEFEKIIQEKGERLWKKLDIQGYVSVNFCSKETIQNLNAQFREKDKPTDVLSWEYSQEEDMHFPFEEDEHPAGEIALCIPLCQEQAEKAGWSLEVEFFRLLVHGMVHLAGYDHEVSEEEEKRMLKVEIELLKEIQLDYVYQD